MVMFSSHPFHNCIKCQTAQNNPRCKLHKAGNIKSHLPFHATPGTPNAWYELPKPSTKHSYQAKGFSGQTPFTSFPANTPKVLPRPPNHPFQHPHSCQSRHTDQPTPLKPALSKSTPPCPRTAPGSCGKCQFIFAYLGDFSTSRKQILSFTLLRLETAKMDETRDKGLWESLTIPVVHPSQSK
ncbi:hypothetical protein B0T16DRAFT_408743 [Cercophora newfieldiana]|uniref:Uncharacterized protein n=1 Tax=Cercophora newfieldiana TaxID=92897 RepID=A0AA39YC47_9PEZI|nr:hypothetical protein B0T16DRAFT_408743 [Cercophora newfieldiana]